MEKTTRTAKIAGAQLAGTRTAYRVEYERDGTWWLWGMYCYRATAGAASVRAAATDGYPVRITEVPEAW